VSTDFVALHDELDRVLSTGLGRAAFRTLEEVIRFDVTVERTGRAVVSGTLASAPGSVTSLSFQFECDRAALGVVRLGLRDIIEQFPERQGGAVTRR
jgi:hypothetical protein